MTATQTPDTTDHQALVPVRATTSMPARQSPAALAEQANEIREVMRAVLVEGTDYGKIPGVARPSLFKSGAEWLLKWGGFGHKLEPVDLERDDQGRKFGITYRCTVVLLHDPSAVVSTCDGYAGYDEDRFYQSVEELEAKERANASKYQRPARPDKWAQPFRAPWNSVLKMAEKRAMVGATLQACAASGLFTQDVEDHLGQSVGAQDASDQGSGDWFVDNGWENEAEMVAFADGTVTVLRGLTPEAQQTFREWREGSGLKLAPATKPQAEAMRAKVDELAAEQPPTIAEGALTTENITDADVVETGPGGTAAQGVAPQGPQ